MKKFINIKLWMCITAILVFLVGCSNEKTTVTKEEAKNNGEFPITIVDGNKDKVTIQKKPSKIISIMPSSTEIIYALNEGSRVIGVSDFDNYPPEVTKKDKYGSMELNIEKVLASKADLLVLSAYHKKTYADAVKQFNDAGITVIAIEDASDFNGTYKTVEFFGEILGNKKKASEIVTSMKSTVEDIKKKAAASSEKLDKKVWVEISPSPEIYTAGKGTFIDEMLTIIHATNIAKEVAGWGKFSDEQVVAANPDVVITTYGSYQPDPEQQVLSRKGWESIQAVKNNQVFDLDNDTLSRPGPRLVDGLKQLAETIYPETFK
ncbi:MAG: iron transporter substrate-binding protein [Bacillales bacterium]|jgi:iron complex transport system substrate-binding protein|nr:iron transporter substrate-binding protein [Bacillales bacterium]